MRKLITYSINSIIKRENLKQLNNEVLKSDQNKRQALHIKKAFDNYQINKFDDSVIDSDFEKLLIKVNKKNTLLYKKLLKYAAIMVLFVGSIITVDKLYYLSDDTSQVVNSKYVTGDDESSLVRLSDGTKIYLAENSRLEIPFDYGTKNRDVKLLGQAYFDVERNEELPFIINSNGYIVKVLGTKFNVKSYENDNLVSTTLQHGKVEIDLTKISDTSQKYILKPNDKFIFNKKTSEVEFKQFSNSITVNYKKSEIKFVNKRFSDILQDLSIFFNVEVENKYEELNMEYFSGRFKTYDNFENIITTLSQVTDFSISKKDGKYLITEK